MLKFKYPIQTELFKALNCFAFGLIGEGLLAGKYALINPSLVTYESETKSSYC